MEERYDYKKIVEELYLDNYFDKFEKSYFRDEDEILLLNFIEKKKLLKEYLYE